ncbi:HAD family hydrolase [Salinispora tropica]|nr:HAD hydrolase-like protein [Salinispora tropica]
MPPCQAPRRSSPSSPTTQEQEHGSPGSTTPTPNSRSQTSPDPAFFDRVVAMTPVSREEILYVGDHPDHDITAGRAARLRTALVRRGPWGHLWSHDPAVRASAHLVASSLDEIRQVLTGTR